MKKVVNINSELAIVTYKYATLYLLHAAQHALGGFLFNDNAHNVVKLIFYEKHRYF